MNSDDDPLVVSDENIAEFIKDHILLCYLFVIKESEEYIANQNQNSFRTIKPEYKTEAFNLVTSSEVLEIFKSLSDLEEGYWIISPENHDEFCLKLQKRIYAQLLDHMVKRGELDYYFDPNENDFVFVKK